MRLKNNRPYVLPVLAGANKNLAGRLVQQASNVLEQLEVVGLLAAITRSSKRPALRPSKKLAQVACERVPPGLVDGFPEVGEPLHVVVVANAVQDSVWRDDQRHRRATSSSGLGELFEGP